MQLLKINLQNFAKSFNIACMEYKFIEELIDKKTILKSESIINPILLENNVNQIEQILKFLQSSDSLMLVSGFLGTGKDTVVKEALNYLSGNAVILNYSCFETTILDDILLEFFDSFRKLTAQNIIQIPKAKSENFTQKISAYFQSIEKPIVIFISSFEEILKDNKQEILNFLFHLSTFSKIKIIITSRKFNLEDFEGKINYQKMSILAFEKHIFEKYLRSNDIKQIGPLSDELYKHTRGYWFYSSLSVKIMKLRNLSLVDFLGGFTKSLMSFNDFILREALAFVDPVSGHLFRFLTIMRHPVSTKLLQTLHLYDETKINFFIENMILAKDKDSLYIQDYYKIIAENSISENIAVKLHRGCSDLYNTQLPLKPLERDILISRQTMRKEIEYHNMFLPKKPLLMQKPISGADFAEYGNSNVQKTIPIEQTPQEIKHEKDDKLKNMSFVFETEEAEMAFMNKIAHSINNFIDKSVQKEKDQAEIKELSLIKLLNLAKQTEQNYDFKKSVIIYHRALELDTDDDYYTFLPTIYTKLAEAYKNLSDWFNSLKYYEMALEFYNSTGDIEKVNEIKLEIANIYYITFKRDKAKELLDNILESKTASTSLEVKTYLLLANICDSKSSRTSIYNYYKHAINVADNTVDKPVLSELYFKFGLILDERDEPEQAVKYYKKCVELDSNPKINTYLSSALTNIATLYDEIGKPDYAAKYFMESLKADELTQNYNGIYQSSTKLAEIYIRRNPEKALEYFKRAKKCALELNETFYIASSDIALGDFYYNKKENESAMKHYVSAYKLAKNNFSKDNIFKIEMRISDLKVRLGEDRFDTLAKELNYAK